MSLFEYKRSDSVLFNVILITVGTIVFTPQNAQLLTRCHLIGISKVVCWGRKMPKLSSHAYKQGSTLAVFRYPEHPRFSDGIPDSLAQ